MMIRAMSRSPLMAGLILAASLIVAGCGGTSGLDTTTDASVNASKNKLSEGMDQKSKSEFNRDLGTIADQNRGKVADTPSALLKPAHGMSVEQIHAKAEELRAQKKP